MNRLPLALCAQSRTTAGPSPPGWFLGWRSWVDSDRLRRYGRTVIRARGLLERGLAARWLGPWVALMLVVFVLLVGVHPVSDEFVHEAAFICAVIALAGVLVPPLVGVKPSPVRTRPEKRRPPLRPFSSSQALSRRRPQFLPAPALIGK